MASLATIAAIATIGGAVVSAGSAVYGGYQQQQAAALAAKQEKAAGDQEFASSQREADQRRLEGQLLMSRQLATAAASGAGAGPDAPTITKILTDTGENADYGARVAEFQGRSRQADYYASADARRSTGSANFFGGILRGLGTLAGGIGNWAGQTA